MAVLLATTVGRAQDLRAAPQFGQIGEPVTVTLSAAAAGSVVGVPVAARLPDGETIPLGATDEAGRVSFVPEQTGVYEFQVRWPGRDLTLITPYQVLDERRSWIYVVVCLGLGAGLLWLHLRRGRDAD